MAKVFGIAVDLNNRDHFAETIGDISRIGSLRHLYWWRSLEQSIWSLFKRTLFLEFEKYPNFDELQNVFLNL